MRFCLLLIFLFLLTGRLQAQSTYSTDLNDTRHLVDRLEIRSGQLLPHLFTTLKPYERKAVAMCADSFETAGVRMSRSDYFNLSYLQQDNLDWSNAEAARSSKPLLKYFYKYKPALYTFRSQDFECYINPVLYFGAGRDGDVDRNLYQNTRGIEIRGMIDKKVGFYSYFSDNQSYFPAYYKRIIDSTGVIPGEGYYKSFKNVGYDYFQARGYVTFSATKHIHFQFGSDRNFIGNGIRSLILSDFAKEYLFLKFNVRIWKFNYQTIFAELIDYRKQSEDFLHGRKNMALHHLSVNLGKRLNIGLFETIIYDRKEGEFEINYLNPIIFYRSVEQNLNSSDNAMLGADFKWNFFRHFSVYGQAVLDEFRLKNVKAMNGWWANKQAFQLGVKYIDAFTVSNLDLQLEGNTVRPFMYTHFERSQNYIHFNQPLAHPAGCNFYEAVGRIRYQPIPRLTLQLNAYYLRSGKDTAGVKYGGNILSDYTGFAKEFGNTLAQGARYDVASAEIVATWMAFHNGFFDLRCLYRKAKSDIPDYRYNTLFISAAFRMNIIPRSFNF